MDMAGAHIEKVDLCPPLSEQRLEGYPVPPQLTPAPLPLPNAGSKGDKTSAADGFTMKSSGARELTYKLMFISSSCEVRLGRVGGECGAPPT